MGSRLRTAFLGPSGEAGGEVGFPGKLGGMAEEPVTAVPDAGFDFRDAGDGPLDILEASVAPGQLLDSLGSFVVESCQQLLLGADLVRDGVDGLLVGPAEAAPLREGLQPSPGSGDVPFSGGSRVAEAQHFALLGGHGVSQRGKVGAEPLQAAEFRSAIGAGSGLDAVPGLFP